jgi:hypothetical protein
VINLKKLSGTLCANRRRRIGHGPSGGALPPNPHLEPLLVPLHLNLRPGVHGPSCFSLLSIWPIALVVTCAVLDASRLLSIRWRRTSCSTTSPSRIQKLTRKGHRGDIEVESGSSVR